MGMQALFAKISFKNDLLQKYQPFTNVCESTKRFSIDPQLTNLDTLRQLIATAFHIQDDFVISYCIDATCASAPDVPTPIGGSSGGKRVLGKTASSSRIADSSSSAADMSRTEQEQASPRYLPMLCDWDLNVAVYGAARPELYLKVDMKSTNLLDEWDIIDADDVLNARSRQPSSSSIEQQSRQPLQLLLTPTKTATDDDQAMTPPHTPRHLQVATNHHSKLHNMVSTIRHSRFGVQIKQLPHLLNVHITDAANRTTRAGRANKQARDSRLAPMDDCEWRAMLDEHGRLVSQERFRLVVYQKGVAVSLRAVVWRHLLNVYPEAMTGGERIAYTDSLALVYADQKQAWQARLRNGRSTEELRLVANAVRKDVVRTDRSLPFFAGDENEQPHLLALFNLLTTYALCHPDISYCQGMSDLAAPLLYVMNGDEAQTYICFCALMLRVHRNFACDGRAMTRKFQHLSELLQHYDPVLFEYLREAHADDLLFAYRWLILELKREFTFEESLRVMEVMWASLPPTSPQTTLRMYDVDLCCVCADMPFSPSTLHLPAAVRASHLFEYMKQASMNGGNSTGGQVSPTAPTCVDDEDDDEQDDDDDVETPNVQFEFCADDTTLFAASIGRRIKPSHETSVCDNTRNPLLVLQDTQLSSTNPTRTNERLDQNPTSPAQGTTASMVTSPIPVGDDCAASIMQSPPYNSVVNNMRQTQPHRELTLADIYDICVGQVTDTTAVRRLAAPADVPKMKPATPPPPTIQRFASVDTSLVKPVVVQVVPEGGAKTAVSTGQDSGYGGTTTPQGVVENKSTPQLAINGSPNTEEHATPVPPPLKVRNYSASSSVLLDSTQARSTTAPIAVTQSVAATSTALADDENLSSSLVNIEYSHWILPPPAELGDGNPFLMFICLTIILEHRDKIISESMGFDEIGMHFDRMVRAHRYGRTLRRARRLYADYLRTDWLRQAEAANEGPSTAY